MLHPTKTQEQTIDKSVFTLSSRQVQKFQTSAVCKSTDISCSAAAKRPKPAPKLKKVPAQRHDISITLQTV